MKKIVSFDQNPGCQGGGGTPHDSSESESQTSNPDSTSSDSSDQSSRQDKALNQEDDVVGLQSHVTDLYTEQDCKIQKGCCSNKHNQPPKFSFRSKDSEDDQLASTSSTGGEFKHFVGHVRDAIRAKITEDHPDSEESPKQAQDQNDEVPPVKQSTTGPGYLAEIKDSVKNLRDAALESVKKIKDSVTQLASTSPSAANLGPKVESEESSSEESMDTTSEDATTDDEKDKDIEEEKQCQ